MIAGALALALSAAFAGAAAYVSFVEQPARLSLGDEALLSEWAPSDQRGGALMAALALVSALCGLANYFETRDWLWAIGALIILMSWPYVFFAMVPTNNRILAVKGGEVGAARDLVRLWGWLEYGQLAIGVVASAVFISAL